MRSLSTSESYCTSESSFTELRTEIAEHKACVNVRYNDNGNYMWCVLAVKYVDDLDHPEHVSYYYYQYRNEFARYTYPI